MDAITRFAITALATISSHSYPSYNTSWPYCNEYLSDCTNKCYVLYTVSCQINFRTTVVADTSDVRENDYGDTDEDDSVNNINSVILSGLYVVSYDEQETYPYGVGSSGANKWNIYDDGSYLLDPSCDVSVGICVVIECGRMDNGNNNSDEMEKDWCGC